MIMSIPALTSPLGEIWFFLVGITVGSFLNVCVVRIPLGQSVVRPRSRCMTCDRFIAWYENVPLFSYLILRGKCRKCKSPIGIQYFILELLSGIIALHLYYFFQPWPVALLLFFFFVAPLIVLSGIDLRHKILPNRITLPMILSGLCLRAILEYFQSPQILEKLHPQGFFFDGCLDSVLGILAGFFSLFLLNLFYEKIRGRVGMGMGDAKLAAALGAFLGWKAIFVIFLLSSIIGSIAGIFWILISKKGRSAAIPFGPFLALAAYFYLFYGLDFIQSYHQMLRSILKH